MGIKFVVVISYFDSITLGTNTIKCKMKVCQILENVKSELLVELQKSMPNI